MTADIDADGRWMTYAELADARGIDHQSARRLASRLKWRRQKDNQRIVRVYVPSQGDTPQRRKQDVSADKAVVVSADISHITSAFAAAVASLTARAETAERRVDQAETRAATPEAARLAAEVQATAVRTLLREAAESLKAEQAARAMVEAKAADLRQAADEARADAAEAAEALREAELTRAAEVDRETVERPNMVASKIDEVQFRRLQEADQARKSLGRLARLKAAWRGE